MSNSNEKFEYFMDRTKEDLDHIRLKVDKLWEFRMMLLGGSVVVSALTGAVMSLVIAYVERH